MQGKLNKIVVAIVVVVSLVVGVFALNAYIRHKTDQAHLKALAAMKQTEEEAGVSVGLTFKYHEYRVKIEMSRKGDEVTIASSQAKALPSDE